MGKKLQEFIHYSSRPQAFEPSFCLLNSDSRLQTLLQLLSLCAHSFTC
jgi:hypothetical protein